MPISIDGPNTSGTGCINATFYCFALIILIVRIDFVWRCVKVLLQKYHTVTIEGERADSKDIGEISDSRSMPISESENSQLIKIECIIVNDSPSRIEYINGSRITPLVVSPAVDTALSSEEALVKCYINNKKTEKQKTGKGEKQSFEVKLEFIYDEEDHESSADEILAESSIEDSSDEDIGHELILDRVTSDELSVD